MRAVVNDQEYVIELKHAVGQGMIKETRRLFVEYAQSLDIDLSFQSFETELQMLPGKYGAPDGALILAVFNDKAVGCVALRKIDENICEMKRLYVQESYRKFGIGKMLINRIIEEASRLDYHYMRLDTLPTMKKAQGLYASLGFYDIDSYVYNPIEGARFMELNLDRNVQDS